MKEKLLESAIIIAIVTTFSYGITYAYQSNYLGYYRLPRMFINLNINTMTPVLIIICLALSVLFAVSTNLVNENPRFKRFIESQKLDTYGKIIWSLVILLSILAGATYLGGSSASGQTDYMVLHQKDGFYVELTTYQEGYSNLMVIAPVNLKNGTMTPKFKTVDVKELNNDEMVNFKNGLKVAQLKDSQELH